ncbi:MAG: M23 family metallopeptidase [Planctomycetota bacterium]|nr:M23 family metallopeptidase [Planctomycetota bacterium]
MIRRTAFLLILAAFALVISPAEGEDPSAPYDVIGTCNKPEQFKALQKQVIPDVVELAGHYEPVARARHSRARSRALEEYKPFADEFEAKWGEKGIEVLVRMMEPCLAPVFRSLAVSDKWYLRFRALYWLYFNEDEHSAELFVENLTHENSMVREVAAVGLTMVLDSRTYKKEYSKKLANILKGENDQFVSSALGTSLEMLKKRKKPRVIYSCESKEDVGKRIRPYLNSYRPAPPSFKVKSYSRSGRSGRLKPTESWSYPVSGFHRKIIRGLKSVPFGELKTPTVYHLGEDVAWFEEGIGTYAIADGVVRLVEAGKGDWGGFVVVEHRIDEDSYCCALYGHSGALLFAEPGDEVKAGQLIGSMGLSFSYENGGHGSHIHFGIFKGEFDVSKCVGYRHKSKGKDDFHSPFEFLDKRVSKYDADEQ